MARKAPELEPNSAEAYNNIAACHGALRSKPDFPWARNSLRWPKAEPMTEDANQPTGDSGESDVLWKVWRWVLAVAVVVMLAVTIRMANSREGAPTAGALQVSSILNQSRQHYQAGRFKECIDTATQAAKLNPYSKQAFNNIGICAGNLGLWDEAIRNTQKALRLDPNFQVAKNNLAWLQQQRLESGATKAR
jgi:Flp pilus assembly protein TadD